MSNGPITTRFEERVNKELARLGNDGDVQVFLARLVRAFIDTIGELEARRELSPTVEALRETIEIIDDTETNAARACSIVCVSVFCLKGLMHDE